MKMQRAVKLASLSLLVGATSLPVQAQNMLEEVLVTAQKREQSLQDVPISIEVVSGETLLQENLLSFEDLARMVPNLEVVELGTTTFISIRGVGTPDNAGIEQSVGLFIDGVHQSRDRQYRSAFLDLDRVEVLRGPQGTLFGKNTTAGALNLTTNRPTQEFQASVTGNYVFESGDYNGEYSVEGFVSGPLTDTLSARFAGRWLDSDGYFENILTGEDEPQQEVATGRLSLLWDATDTLSFLLKYENSDSETDGGPMRTVDALNATSQLGIRIEDALALYEANNNVDVPMEEGDYIRSAQPDDDDTESDALTLTVNWDIGDFEVTSITGYSEFDYTQRRDVDFLPLNVLSQLYDQDFESFSQEIRLASPSNDTFEYLVGVFYQDTEINDERILDFDLDLLQGGTGEGLPPYSQYTDYSSDSETWAGFGQGTWFATDRLSLTLGLRYADEEKSGDRRVDPTYYSTNTPIDPVTDPELFTTAQFLLANFQVVAPHEVSADRSSDNFDYNAKVQFDLNDSVMLYTSVGTATKSGGFDSQSGSPEAFEFDDEDTISYEVGMKSTLLDGALKLNLAGFFMEIDDPQFTYFDGIGFTIGNSGKDEAKGVEFDANWLITDNLNAVLSAAYLDSETKENDLVPEREGESGDPDWTANFRLNHTFDLTGALDINSGLRVEYVDDQISSSLGGLELDSYTILDLRVALAESSGQWEVAVVGKNLTDEEVFLAGSQIPGTDIGITPWMREPRNIGLQVRYDF